MFGKEFKVGDFVAYSTSCTGTGYLRRGLVTRSIEKQLYYDKSIVSCGVGLKSITPIFDKRDWAYVVNENGKQEYTMIGTRDVIVIGTCTRETTVKIAAMPEYIKFDEIIALGSDYTAVFSERERAAIRSCNTKLVP